jgi:hypothetical protein
MSGWDATKKRPIKKQITEGLFEYIKETNPGKVFKCFLCLPSTRATDVEEALKQGVIDLDTKIIAIEKEPEFLLKVKLRLTKLGFGPKSRVVINKDLCNVNTGNLIDACKELDVDSIDLFYIDSCSCLIDCLQDWIEDVASNDLIASKNRVVVTNVLAARATWDLRKYDKYPTDITDYGDYDKNYNKNKWSNSISRCLSSRTGLDTGLTVGYKEENVATPMVLCVNHHIDLGPIYYRDNDDRFGNQNLPRNYLKAINKAVCLQNLGYK